MPEVKISISGFTKTQVTEGLPHLLDEFGHRPWLLNPRAFLDETSNKLIVIVGYENNFRLEEGALDEISDCVIATMNFDKEMIFDIQRI